MFNRSKEENQLKAATPVLTKIGEWSLTAAGASVAYHPAAAGHTRLTEIRGAVIRTYNNADSPR